MTIDAGAAVVSAFVAVAGLYLAWSQWEIASKAERESALRKGDVLAWSNEVIEALESLLLLCILQETQIDGATAKIKLLEVIFNTATLVDRGRLFFKNKKVRDFGDEKHPAFQGYRLRILDPIVAANQIACSWVEADEGTRKRMAALAEDCLRKFVSLAQMEIGRDRTASVMAAEPGDSTRLRRLLDEVSEQQLRTVRRASYLEPPKIVK